LVEYKFSKNTQIYYKQIVGRKHKLQFSFGYTEKNNVVKRSKSKKSRILCVLIEHAVSICQSVKLVLENQGKVVIGRKEDIRLNQITSV
jgi:hypothetical protein